MAFICHQISQLRVVVDSFNTELTRPFTLATEIETLMPSLTSKRFQYYALHTKEGNPNWDEGMRHSPPMLREYLYV